MVSILSALRKNTRNFNSTMKGVHRTPCGGQPRPKDLVKESRSSYLEREEDMIAFSTR